MALPDIDTVFSWRGRTIVDAAGEKIGKFEGIYLDTDTDRPEWAAVKAGLLGRGELLVPLTDAEEHDDALRVPFEKSHVEAAPRVAAGGELSQDEEARLYAHYGIAYSHEDSGTGLPPGGEAGRVQESARAGAEPGSAGAHAGPVGGGAGAAGDRVGSAGDQAGSAGAEVTRSEEEVAVGTDRRPRERVRLAKYVVTEEVTKKVPVQREEIRVEREPVDPESDPGAA